jgi:hypothetical protein
MKYLNSFLKKKILVFKIEIVLCNILFALSDLLATSKFMQVFVDFEWIDLELKSNYYTEG